jgi:hypothetical protein
VLKITGMPSTTRIESKLPFYKAEDLPTRKDELIYSWEHLWYAHGQGRKRKCCLSVLAALSMHGHSIPEPF